MMRLELPPNSSHAELVADFKTIVLRDNFNWNFNPPPPPPVTITLPLVINKEPEPVIVRGFSICVHPRASVVNSSDEVQS